MAAFAFLGIQSQIGVDHFRQAVIGLFRFGGGLPFESAVFGDRFFGVSGGFGGAFAGFVRTAFDLFVLGVELYFFFGDLSVDLVEVGVQAPDLHLVIRFKLLEFGADLRHLLFIGGKTVF